MGQLENRMTRLEAGYAETLERRWRDAWASGPDEDLAHATATVLAFYGPRETLAHLVAWSGIPEAEWLTECERVVEACRG